MKILHTVSDFNLKSGGPTTCLYSLLKGMNLKKVGVDILTFSPEKITDLPGDDEFIKTVEAPNEKKMAYSKPFHRFLVDNEDYSLYHINGMWQYPSHCTAKYARGKKKPYIISPHGMLYPQALRYSKNVKKLLLQLWFKKDLAGARCIHATCEEEMIHLRNMGVSTPVAVIANPIDVFPIEEKEKGNVVKVGYLGRIHHRKNIERLIYAWNNLKDLTKGKELLIIGDGDDNYMNFLKNEVARLELSNVIFTGFLSGKEKDDTIRSLSCLVVPSDFENFGMIIPEALVLKVPVIASTGTPWKDLNDYECGWWVDNDVDTLTKSVQEAITLSDEEHKRMGENGRKLIVEKYSTEVIASQMKSLYEWILNGGEKPDFVFL